MITTLLVTQLLQWVVIGGLLVVIVALARQIGVIHERVAPVGALSLQDNVEVGENAPVVSAQTLGGETLSVGGADPEGLDQLLLFVSPRCPICKTILPIARDLESDEDELRLVLIGDGDPEPHRRLVERENLESVPFVVSAEVGLAFGVGKLPYAILIDGTGTIRSKGMVSTREHLESLVVAREEGVGSIQQYVAERTNPRSDPEGVNGSPGASPSRPPPPQGSGNPTYLRLDREETDD